METENSPQIQTGRWQEASQQMLRRWGGFLFGSAQMTITVGYLMLVFIGAAFEYCFYRNFGLNILYFSDLRDFVLKPLRDPMIVLFTTISWIVLWLLLRFDAWLVTKYPRFGNVKFGWRQRDKPWFAVYYNVLWLTMAVYYVGLVAFIYGRYEYREVQHGHGPKMEIETTAARDTLIFIGKAGETLFLYDTTGQRLRILPMSTVKSLSPLR